MGMRHAIDPDHVIAVTTIVSRERRLIVASRIGLVWGLGHTLTVLAVGASLIVFKLAIPARLGLAMEFAVAMVLILLGIGVVSRLLQGIMGRTIHWRLSSDHPLAVHSHRHSHGRQSHRHPHVHCEEEEQKHSPTDTLHHHHALPEDVLPPLAVRHPLLRSFGVGVVHGLAGSAAIALLVLSAIPETLWAVLYLVLFCCGTIVGMGLITTAIAMPFMVAAERLSWMHQSLVTGSGLLSFGFGVFLAYQLGIVDHLFSGAPVWTPR
jgi:ABC-type nickel/cobalt efflux system permease component RcnA